MPGEPGEIVAIERGGIVVACGKGALVLEIVQKSRRKKAECRRISLGASVAAGRSL